MVDSDTLLLGTIGILALSGRGSADDGDDGGDSPPQNESPVADFTADTSGLSMTCDAGPSHDPDGTITGFNWEALDGNQNIVATGSGTAFSHTFATGGTYEVRLYVTDNAGDSDSIAKNITVADSGGGTNQAPVAEFTLSGGTLAVSADASQSRDPDGSITSYDWRLVGPLAADTKQYTGSGVRPSWDVHAGGTYEARLVVADDGGKTDQTKNSVSVQGDTGGGNGDTNETPTARVTASVGDFGFIYCDATQSADPDGTIQSYEWTITSPNGNQRTEHGPEPTVPIWDGQGVYNCSCTVTDDGGASDTDTTSVDTGNSNGGSDTWEQTIYTSTRLYSNHGRAPEEMVARYLERAFQRIGINAEITRGYETQDDPFHDPGCSGTTTSDWWNTQLDDGNVPHEAKDSNLLLIEANGGGCAGVGGNAAVVGGDTIDTTESELIENSPEHYYVSIAHALHEIGHNMGYSHSGGTTPGWGIGWKQDGLYHRTPTCNPAPDQNACGESIPEKSNEANRHLYYHDCVAENIQIADSLEEVSRDVPTMSDRFCPGCRSLE